MTSRRKQIKRKIKQEKIKEIDKIIDIALRLKNRGAIINLLEKIKQTEVER